MKQLLYIDKEGYKWISQLPDTASIDEISQGVLIGPPEFRNYQKEFAIKLHNELFDRGIYTYLQAKANRQGIMQAIQSVLKFSAIAIEGEYKDA